MSEEDVLRFDVAVDHTVTVGIVQGVGDLACNPERLLDRKLGLSLEPVAETLPFYVRHGVPQETGHLAGGQYRQNVRVVQSSGDSDLVEEALAAERGGQIGMEQLERDGAATLQVLREVDRGHAAPAELAFDPVTVAQGIDELPGWGGHEAAPVIARSRLSRPPW